VILAALLLAAFLGDAARDRPGRRGGTRAGVEPHRAAAHGLRITRLGGQPELLTSTFGIDKADLPAKAVSDPRAAVAVDVAAIKDNPFLPADFIVSGLVYDVRTGLIETVVAPSLLRESTAA
jgi:carbonic anhydrase